MFTFLILCLIGYYVHNGWEKELKKIPGIMALAMLSDVLLVVAVATYASGGNY